MSTVLITGANGFIGRALGKRMLSRGWQVRGTVRSLESLDSLPTGVDAQKINSIGPDADWTKALIGIDRLIGSLCVDSSKIRATIDWKPPYTPEEGIRETVLWYKERRRKEGDSAK